jgi:hypothetical protein
VKDILSLTDRVARQKPVVLRVAAPRAAQPSLEKRHSDCFLLGYQAMPPPRRRGTLKEEGMTRKLALTAGILFSVLSAGTLTAQTAATTKPSSSSSTMQHSKTSMSKGQDSTSVRSSAATKTHHAMWSTDQIKEAQEGLAKAGFYKGQPTGRFNRSTRNAIREYQKANKLKVTGRLSNELLTKLRSTS